MADASLKRTAARTAPTMANLALTQPSPAPLLLQPSMSTLLSLPKANERVVAHHSSWLVELHATQFSHPELVEVTLPYREHFGATAPHWNFFVKDSNTSFTPRDSSSPRFAVKSVLSIQKQPSARNLVIDSLINRGTSYDAVYFTEEGHSEFELHNVAAKASLKTFVLEDSLESFLKEKLVGDKMVGLVNDKKAIVDLLHLETKHSLKLKTVKLATLFVNAGQTDMEEIFANKPADNSRFYEFMDSIADRIDMNGWPHYRGEMGEIGSDNDASAYYSKWEGVEMLFHVAPWMDSEQHRRLCGNDIGVLIFYDRNGTDKPFVPFEAAAMGTVPHVFFVVEVSPQNPKRYRLGFFQRTSIGSYAPNTPPFSIDFDEEGLKEFLFTKILNGFLRAFSVPPLDRLFKTPRSFALKQLGEQYPLITAKDREKQRKSERVTDQEATNRKLCVTAVSGRNLVSKDSNGLSDPFVVVTIGQETKKTEVIKKTLNPTWNQILNFPIASEDALDEISCVVWDWNSNGKYRYMGEFRARFTDLVLGEPTWYTLSSATGDPVSGDIQIVFHVEVESEKTPQQQLISAVKKGDESLVRSLLYLHPYIRNKMDPVSGAYPLQFAVKKANRSLVELMLSKGANINSIDRETGWNILHYAAESGDPSMVYFLVQGTNVQIVNTPNEKDMNYPMHYYCKNFNEDLLGVIPLMIEYGADVNAVNANGETALHLAAWKGRTNLVRALLLHGADVHKENKRNESALHFAARSGSLETVKLLVASQGDLYKTGPQGTPVDVAHPSIKEAVKKLASAPSRAFFKSKTSFAIAYENSRAKANPFDNSVVSKSSEWLIESPSNHVPNPNMQALSYEYSDQFAALPHLNFVIKNDGQLAGVLSVLTKAEDPVATVAKDFNFGENFKAIFTHERGAEVFFMSQNSIGGTSGDFGANLLHFLSSRVASEKIEVQAVSNFTTPIIPELEAFEHKHSGKILSAFKVAILYAKDTQSDLKEILANKPEPQSDFYKFLDSLAAQSDTPLSPTSRDLAQSGTGVSLSTYQTKWKNVDVLFHVAPLMQSQEQQLRLCSNDVAFLIYHEVMNVKVPFTPFASSDLGATPHIFAVVQHKALGNEAAYRVGFFQRSSVEPFRPHCPPSLSAFSPGDVKEFVLAKLYNGILKANGVPPLDRVTALPRSQAFHDLAGRLTSLSSSISPKQSSKGNIRSSQASGKK